MMHRLAASTAFMQVTSSQCDRQSAQAALLMKRFATLSSGIRIRSALVRQVHLEPGALDWRRAPTRETPGQLPTIPGGREARALRGLIVAS